MIQGDGPRGSASGSWWKTARRTAKTVPLDHWQCYWSPRWAWQGGPKQGMICWTGFINRSMNCAVGSRKTDRNRKPCPRTGETDLASYGRAPAGMSWNVGSGTLRTRSGSRFLRRQIWNAGWARWVNQAKRFPRVLRALARPKADKKVSNADSRVNED